MDVCHLIAQLEGDAAAQLSLAIRGLLAERSVNPVEIDLTDWLGIAGVFEVVLEEFEIAFVDLVDEVHREIVEKRFHRMGALRPVTRAFVEAWNIVEVHRNRDRHMIEHVAHSVIELLGPEDAIIVAAIHDKG